MIVAILFAVFLAFGVFYAGHVVRSWVYWHLQGKEGYQHLDDKSDFKPVLSTIESVLFALTIPVLFLIAMMLRGAVISDYVLIAMGAAVVVWVVRLCLALAAYNETLWKSSLDAEG